MGPVLQRGPDAELAMLQTAQQQAMPTRKEGSLVSAAQPHVELCGGWSGGDGTRYEVGRTDM